MRSGDRPGPGRRHTRNPARASRPSATGGQAGRMLLGVGWFPTDVFDAALRRWPQLAGLWETRDYATYCRLLEQAMVNYSRHASPRLIAFDLEQFERWAAAEGMDPGAETARAGYAAEQVRVGAPGPAWPPAATDPCWCGSGKLYVRCCSSTATAAFRRNT